MFGDTGAGSGGGFTPSRGRKMTPRTLAIARGVKVVNHVNGNRKLISCRPSKIDQLGFIGHQPTSRGSTFNRRKGVKIQPSLTDLRRFAVSQPFLDVGAPARGAINTNGPTTPPIPLVPSSPVPYGSRCCGRFPLEAQQRRPLETDHFSVCERLAGEQYFDWPPAQAGVDAAGSCGGGRGVLRVSAARHLRLAHRDVDCWWVFE
jgi:hypothetical protein